MNAVGIVGLYFALIGFISGIFFTRLESWYSDVRSKRGTILQNIQMAKSVDSYTNLEIPFKGLNASKPLSSFLGIGGFVSGLAILSAFIPITDSGFNPLIFLYLPVALTVLGYWIGGLLIFKSGSRAIEDSLSDIDKAKRGEPISVSPKIR